MSSSVRLSSVCRLSSVTFVRPTQAIEIFGNIFTPRGTLAIRDLCIKILRRSSQGNPFDGGLNRRGVAKFSDFWPFQGYISETMRGGKLLLITNRKSYMGFRLVQNSVTLDDLERRNKLIAITATYNFTEFGSFRRKLRKKWLKIHIYFRQWKCRPKNLVFGDISFMAILAGDHP